MKFISGKCFVALSAVVVTMLAATLCETAYVQTGELRTECRSFGTSQETGQAKSAQVELKMNVGDLKLSGGSTNVADVGFTYNVDIWKPKFEYGVKRDVGKLLVSQPQNQSQIDGMAVNEWDISLKNDLPVTLKLGHKVGNTTLDLDGLRVSNLSLRQEVGNVYLTLSGENPQVASLDVNCRVGDVTVDLTGKWKQSMKGTITLSVGHMVVRVPRNVGVRIEVDKGLGELDAGDLQQQGNVYVNDAYGKSNVTLNLKVKNETKSIKLIQDKPASASVN